MISRVRARLTYANVVATTALFVALGGSSYAALSLPRNSVGPAQIRARAVGASELRRGAVFSRHLHDGSVGLRDISARARAALRGARGIQGPPGAQGPPGPTGITYRAAINSAGQQVHGNATASGHVAPNQAYRVAFAQPVDDCVFTATLARIEGATVVDPPPGRITVATDNGEVVVNVFDKDGNGTDAPFNLIVAC